MTHLSNSPWVPPECNPVCLMGYRNSEDRGVRTSPIKEVDGSIIRTESGSTYFLGDPDPAYLRYLEENGIDFDPKNPIKDKRTS